MEEQNKLNKLDNNVWFKFWNNFFNFMNNRTTIISCSSFMSLIFILILVLMFWNQMPDIGKINPTQNMTRTVFSSMPYDLCEL